MIIRLRRILFCCAYWATSVFFVLVAAPLLLLPGRKPVLSWIRLYTKTIAFWLRWIAGVRVTVRGMEKLPPGPVVIAAKHQSWGDGILLFAALGDLAFVAGDHLEKFPLVGGIVRKMGAILVDNCGGALARARLIDQDLNQAKAEGRRILIYPEGHLAPV
ncbi:MAG: lysophospholipid acyltransferase family protein, partial [Hyphococcus sp.]